MKTLKQHIGEDLQSKLYTGLGAFGGGYAGATIGGLGGLAIGAGIGAAAGGPLGAAAGMTAGATAGTLAGYGIGAVKGARIGRSHTRKGMALDRAGGTVRKAHRKQFGKKRKGELRRNVKAARFKAGRAYERKVFGKNLGIG